ncbi:MAG: PadR family transcriptional regulator [Bacteroidota bacterium]
MRIGEYEEIILLLVGILGENAYAFKLAEEYKDQTGKGTTIGTIHSALERLTDKGLLESVIGASSAKRGGRRKRIYSLTADGYRVLSDIKAVKTSLWNQYPGFSLEN